MPASHRSLNFRHIVITGASSGIGAALAKYYARSGARISLLGRDAARVQAVTQQCIAAGATACSEIGDVTDGLFMTRWLADCDAREPVDLVIANAGIGGQFAMPPQSGETVDVAHKIFSTNTIGVANSILPILPRFVERRRGQLIMLSSLAAYIGLPDAPAYSASKAAIRIYGHGLRRLLARHGVRVTVVCPGFVQTPMSNSIPGRLPFLWDAERAARHIANGVARGQNDIAFPWQLAMLSRFAAILPSFVLDPVLDRISYRRAIS
jgi:short-subunit dehydrogenase